MKLANAFLTFFSMARPISGACKAKGEKITQGAFWDVGVNGTWDPQRYSDDNVNTQDYTWTVPPNGTWTYPQGEPGSRGGVNVRGQLTCSNLKFCNPEDDLDLVQSVYVLPDKSSFESCYFGNAQLVGNTGPNGTCVEIQKDDTKELKFYYYANKENCEKGQKIVVNLQDWESTAKQCAAIADHIPASSRIRGCDCDFQKKPFGSYNPVCAYAYQELCMEIEQKGECCATNTCWSSSELFSHANGKSKEMKRRETCDNDVPGNCYNQDGKATDVNQLGSTDCCTQTCQTCGTELANGVKWMKCTANDPSNMTATCGSLSRYSKPFVCDFSKCADDTAWSPKNAAINKYMGLPTPDESFAPSPSSYFAVLSMIFPFLF